MVNINVTLGVRGQNRQDRLDRMKQHRRPGVRVLPKDDGVRKYIAHQPTGIRFRSEGAVEWPNDRFTQRRLADGTVTLAEDQQQSTSEPARRPSRGATSD
jgi:hypothetical protein